MIRINLLKPESKEFREGPAAPGPEIRAKKAFPERKISPINQLRAQQDSAVVILDELSKNLPDWVWLTEVSFQGQLIQIKGNALSNNLIADFIYNLENSAHFATVNLISSTQRTGRSAQLLEFSLTLNS